MVKLLKLTTRFDASTKKTRCALAPLMVRLPAPGPLKAMLFVTSGNGLPSVIVPVAVILIVALEAEYRIACLNDPGPESLVVFTVMLVPGRVVNVKSPVTFVPAAFVAIRRK